MRIGERAREFEFEGYRLAYGEWGSGERVLVLVHGLLMNRYMYAHLAPAMARRGFRVIAVDLLGHGESDQPRERQHYTISAFADQVAGLVDGLGLRHPVVGGTSLGANTALELAVRHPGLPSGLVIEMPVLDNALVAAGAIFLPILVGLRFGRPLVAAVAAVTRRVPRSHYLLDILLDWTRRDPVASRAVLEGLLFGRTAPPRDERREIDVPALVIGHHADPLHPFSDSDMLAAELPRAQLVNANSIVEWRVWPRRLDDQLAEFLAAVFDSPSSQARAA